MTSTTSPATNVGSMIASGPGWVVRIRHLDEDEKSGDVLSAEFRAIIAPDPLGHAYRNDRPIDTGWEWRGPGLDSEYDDGTVRSYVTAGALHPYGIIDMTPRQTDGYLAAIAASLAYIRQEGWDRPTARLEALLAEQQAADAAKNREWEVDRVAKKLAAPLLDALRRDTPEADWERAQQVIRGRTDNVKRIQAIVDLVAGIRETAKAEAEAQVPPAG